MAAKKKVTKKPAAKKAAPVKKLIDGVYSHKFTLRLYPEAGEALESTKRLLNTKSYSTVIEKSLIQYEPNQKRIKELEDQVSNLKEAIRESKTVVSNFTDSIAGLQAFNKSLEKNKDVLVDDDDLIECWNCDHKYDGDKFEDCPKCEH